MCLYLLMIVYTFNAGFDESGERKEESGKNDKRLKEKIEKTVFRSEVDTTKIICIFQNYLLVYIRDINGVCLFS